MVTEQTAGNPGVQSGGAFFIDDSGPESTADAEVVVREVAGTAPHTSFTEACVQKAITSTASGAKKVCDYHRKHPYRCLATAAIGGVLIGLLIGHCRKD